MHFEFKPQKSRGHKHYLLTSDKDNIILNELKKVKSRETGEWKVDEDGNYELKQYTIGYFRSPIDVIQRLVEYDIMDTDDDAIKDFPDMIKAWGELVDELKVLLKEVK